MSDSTLAALAARAPVGPVPLADPDFLTAQTGPPPLPDHVLARIKLPLALDLLCCLGKQFHAEASRNNLVAHLRQCANYIEIFTVAP